MRAPRHSVGPLRHLRAYLAAPVARLPAEPGRARPFSSRCRRFSAPAAALAAIVLLAGIVAAPMAQLLARACP